jgi:hypothetical protein
MGRFLPGLIFLSLIGIAAAPAQAAALRLDGDAAIDAYGSAAAPADAAIPTALARTPTAVAAERSAFMRQEGVAQTAIDHRFGGDGTTGSAGFLCGLTQGFSTGGAAEARGVNPDGKFLGAQLKLPF